MTDSETEDTLKDVTRAGPWTWAQWAWLAAIGLTMWGSAYDLLSPRPAAGQVAALWVPNAVLMVAVLRNLNRPFFILAGFAAFLVTGMYPSLTNGDAVATLILLILDFVEIGLVVLVLNLWGGGSFQFESPTSVAIFSGGVMLSCLIVGAMVGFASTFDVGDTPIQREAPFVVGLAWFLADSATYMLVAAPLVAISGRGGPEFFKRCLNEWPKTLGAIGGAIGLTLVSFWAPRWFDAISGVDLGNGGLSLLAAPLAIFVAVRRGPIAGAWIAALIGIPSVYATMAGLGPFRMQHVDNGVFELQTSLILSVVTVLLVGAMAQELAARSQALQRTLDEITRARR